MKYASVGVRYFGEENEYHDDMGRVADIYSWYDKNTIELHRTFVNVYSSNEESFHEEETLYYTVYTVFEDIPKDVQEALKHQSQINLGGFKWLNP